jgi:phage-related protein
MPGSYNLGTASGRIVVDGKGAQEGFSVAGAAATGFTDAVKAQGEAIQDTANKLLLIGGSGAASIALATNSAANFEQRLSAIQAVSGATAEEMDAVAEAALRIGADTSFSATEAASAIEELIKAGISVEETLNGAADATVALAAAGEISLPRAAEIAAAAMNNFNLTGADMPRIADLIAGAANASAIGVEEFGVSLQQVGAVANLTGMDFQDVSVAIAEMGNAGIKGSDAGTSLKTMLMNLIPVTDRQTEKFRELGLLTDTGTEAMVNLTEAGFAPASSSMEDITKATEDYLAATEGLVPGTEEMTKATEDWIAENVTQQNAFFDSEGKIKDLADIQKLLADSTKNLTDEQKLSTLEIMFGADAIRAAAVMADEGAEGYDKMYAAMSEVGAAEVAATRLDNLKGSQEELSGSLETMSISIGKYFLAPMQKLVEAATAGVNAFNSLPEPVKQVVAVLLGTGTAVSLLLGILPRLIILLYSLGKAMVLRSAGAALITTLVNIRGAALGSGMAMTTAIAPLTNFAARAGKVISTGPKLIGVLRGIGAAVAFMTGPWGIVIAAVAAAALAFKHFYENNAGFKEWVDGIVTQVRDFFQPAIDSLKAAWDSVVSIFSGGDGGEVPGWFAAMIPVVEWVRDLWLDLVDAWNNQLYPALQEAGAVIQGAFLSAWQTLVNVWNTQLKPAFDELWGVLQTSVIPALQGMWEAIWPIIKVVGIIVGAILGGLIFALFKVATFIIGTVLPAFITFAAWLVGGLLKVIAAVAGWIAQYLIVPLTKLVTFILSKVGPIWDWLSEKVGAAWDWIVAKVGPIITAIIDWFKNLFNPLEEGAEKGHGVLTSVGQWFSDLWAKIVGIFTGIGDWFGGIFDPIYQAIQAAIAWFQPFITFIQGVWVTIQGIFQIGVTVITGIWNVLWAVITGVAQIAWAIIQGLFHVGFNFVKGLLASFVAYWTNTWNTLVGFIRSVMTVIKTIWRAAWTAIRAVATAVWNAVKTFISTRISEIRNAINIILNAIKKIWNAAWNAVKTALTPIWNTIKTIVSNAIQAVKTRIEGPLNTIKTLWNNAWKAVKTAVTEKWNEIKTVISEKIQGIKDFFSNAGTWLLTAGRNIIDGLIQGIRDKFASVTATISELSGNISGGIKDFFGISSPAKLTIEYGQNIGEGLRIGIGDSVISIMRQLDQLNEATSGKFDNMETAANISPHITISTPMVPATPSVPTAAGATEAVGDVITIEELNMTVPLRDLKDIQMLERLINDLQRKIRAQQGAAARRKVSV